jgi:hypothetical protein
MAALTKREYTALLRKAEEQLISHGVSDLEERIHILTGIYYGTPWCLDFKVEYSRGRNFLFERFLGKSFDASDDARPLIGVDLFHKLQSAQDSGGVDMGHLLIGLDARMRSAWDRPKIWGIMPLW